jgi:hypothetical protein
MSQQILDGSYMVDVDEPFCIGSAIGECPTCHISVSRIRERSVWG